MLITKFNIKIYDKTGANFLKTISSSLSDIGSRNSLITNIPTFKNVINGSQGQCKFILNTALNDFGEGDYIDYMNIVRLFAVNSRYPTGKLIYSGFIYSYQASADENSSTVEVATLGIGALLSETTYRNGSNTTINLNNTDSADMIRDIVDKHKTIFSFSPIDYNVDSIDDLGDSKSTEFQNLKSNVAINKVFENVQNSHYWYVDENGLMNFKAYRSVPNHTFIFGKDVARFKALKDSKSIINSVILKWSSGTVTDQDPNSILKFGLREKYENKTDITSSSAAQEAANAQVAENKDPKIRTTITINNQYPIEDIKPGDSCRVVNLPFNSQVFTNNMLIVGVTYNWDNVILELEAFGQNLFQAVKLLTN